MAERLCLSSMASLQPTPFDVLQFGTKQEAFKTLDLVPARRDDDRRQVAEPDIHGREEQVAPPPEPLSEEHGAHPPTRRPPQPWGAARAEARAVHQGIRGRCCPPWHCSNRPALAIRPSIRRSSFAASRDVCKYSSDDGESLLAATASDRGIGLPQQMTPLAEEVGDVPLHQREDMIGRHVQRRRDVQPVAAGQHQQYGEDAVGQPPANMQSASRSVHHGYGLSCGLGGASVSRQRRSLIPTFRRGIGSCRPRLGPKRQVKWRARRLAAIPRRPPTGAASRQRRREGRRASPRHPRDRP